MSELTLSEVIEYLRVKKYLLIYKGKYSLSKSFHDDKAKLNTVPIKDSLIPFVVNKDRVLKPTTEDWQLAFLTFIKDAKVPDRCDNGKGEFYETNKYSEDAMKVFRNAVRDRECDYSLLVKSTMLYYHSSTRFKKKIGNYFIDGDWLSDYVRLLEKAEQGEEAVIEHIKQETKDGTHNPWT